MYSRATISRLSLNVNLYYYYYYYYYNSSALRLLYRIPVVVSFGTSSMPCLTGDR